MMLRRVMLAAAMVAGLLALLPATPAAAHQQRAHLPRR